MRFSAVAAISGAIRKALQSNPVRALFEQDALIAVGDSPEQFSAHVKRELGRYAEAVRKGNLTVP